MTSSRIKIMNGSVFISHSHLDFDRVRLVRNIYEENHFNVICFYLQCLENENEINDLIKREIKCRKIFLYMNSVNSRCSKWVNMEREYIKKFPDKLKIQINLDESKKTKYF